MRKIGYLRSNEEETGGRLLPPDWIIRFDSGETIGVEDAKRHIGIFGSTGTGKTASCVYPIIHRHIELGHPVVMIDIKGVMRAKIRGMARAAGREADYIEFGTSPSSTPLNIISGLEPGGFNAFLMGMLEQAIKGRTGNQDFHFKAVRMATDCYQLLCWLAERDTRYAPTFSLISEMFAEPAMAAEMFSSFTKQADLTEEQRQFVATVKGRLFHVLNQTSEIQKRASSTHSEQCAYYTQMIDATLREMLDSPGIREKFCDPDADGVDFFSIFLGRKICVINFRPETGPIGARLARHLLASAYATIYRMGPGLGTKLICVDEFHEVADLSGNRYSDSNFIALAREFDTSFVCATQSANALRAAGHDDAAVSAFISNLNTKLFFHTEDPFTREIAAAHDPDTDLAALPPHEAFAAWYDGEYRKGIRQLDQMYNYTRGIEPVQFKLKANLDKAVKEDTSPAVERQASPRLCCSPLFRKFRNLFTEEPSIHVPVGYFPYVERVLAFFSDLQLGLRLKSLRMTAAGNIWAESEGKPSELEMLNEWLKPTMYLCVRCGEPLPVRVRQRKDGSLSIKKTIRTEMLCSACADRYLPDIPLPEPEPYVEEAPVEIEDQKDSGYPQF